MDIAGEHPDPRSTEVRVSEDERGQGMVEYAFILVLIAIVLIVMLQVLGNQTHNMFSNISNGLGN